MGRRFREQFLYKLRVNDTYLYADSVLTVNPVFLYCIGRVLTNKKAKKRHGMKCPPPKKNTIKEYFTPILLGLKQTYVPRVYTKVPERVHMCHKRIHACIYTWGTFKG